MPGRKRKPTALKKLQGTNQPCRMSINEPMPDRIAPACPEWIKELDYEVHWNYYIEVLDNMGLLTIAERDCISRKAYVHGELIQLARDLRVEGRTLQFVMMDSMGNEIKVAKPNPKAIQLKALLTEDRQLDSELGLSPASRGKLSTGKGDKEDPLEAFLNGK